MEISIASYTIKRKKWIDRDLRLYRKKELIELCVERGIKKTVSTSMKNEDIMKLISEDMKSGAEVFLRVGRETIDPADIMDVLLWLYIGRNSASGAHRALRTLDYVSKYQLRNIIEMHRMDHIASRWAPESYFYKEATIREILVHYLGNEIKSIHMEDIYMMFIRGELLSNTEELLDEFGNYPELLQEVLDLRNGNTTHVDLVRCLYNRMVAEYIRKKYEENRNEAPAGDHRDTGTVTPTEEISSLKNRIDVLERSLYDSIPEDHRCGICMGYNDLGIVLVPCGHRSLCKKCPAERCPVCNQSVTSIVTIR
jgi:hypothetical protein